MEQTSYSRAEKRQLQAQWLDARMHNNPRWNFKHDQRVVSIRANKQYVLWACDNNTPRIIDTLRVDDIEASFTSGITIFCTTSRSATRMRISSFPREVFPGVWAWIPPFAELRFCPFSEDDHSVWRLTLPMVVRTRAEHEVSFSTRKEFRDLWPNVSL